MPRNSWREVSTPPAASRSIPPITEVSTHFLEIFDMPIMTNFCGIIPAIAVPFRADYGVDEQELRRFAVLLAQRKGVVGLMTNAHTGEVFSLITPALAAVTG